MADSPLQEALAVPVTYRGDNRITRILQHLGVKYIIAHNPYVIEKAEMILRELYSDKEGKNQSLPNEITEGQVAEIASMLEPKLAYREIEEYFRKMREKTRNDIAKRENGAKDYRIEYIGKRYGIFLDRLTDEFIIQELVSFQHPSVGEHISVTATELVRKITFKIGQNGGVVVITKSERNKDEIGKTETEARTETVTEETYVNSMGIVESRKVTRHDGRQVKVNRTEDAIIAKVEYIAQKRIRYYVMDLGELPNMMENRINFSGKEDLSGFNTLTDAKNSDKYKGTKAALQDLTALRNKDGEVVRTAVVSPQELFRPRYAYGMTALLENKGFPIDLKESR